MKAKATWKRLLSLLLAMVMLVGVLPLSSLAATTDKTTVSTAKTELTEIKDIKVSDEPTATSNDVNAATKAAVPIWDDGGTYEATLGETLEWRPDGIPMWGRNHSCGYVLTEMWPEAESDYQNFRVSQSGTATSNDLSYSFQNATYNPYYSDPVDVKAPVIRFVADKVGTVTVTVSYQLDFYTPFINSPDVGLISYWYGGQLYYGYGFEGVCPGCGNQTTVLAPNQKIYTYEFTFTINVTEPTPVENEYKLVYDANGGTVDPASKTVTYDAAIGELPVPTKTGYEFAGWFVGDTQYTAETVYTVDGDTTLTAHWTASAFNLTLDFGGHQETITRRVSMDAPIGELPGVETTYSTPKDSGGVSYIYFVGGWTDEDGNVVTADTIFTYAKDVTLTATWIPVPIKGDQEADVLFTILCDTDGTHKWEHNEAHTEFVEGSLRLEDGVWKADVVFTGMGFCNFTTPRQTYFGNHEHYNLDGTDLTNSTKYTFTLYYDPAQEGTHYDGAPYVGQWKPVGGADAEANTIHVMCYEKPAAPTLDKIKSSLNGKLLWIRDKNDLGNSMKVTTKTAVSKTNIPFSSIVDTLTIGEPYQENGNFYVKLKIADLTPYLDAFRAQYGDAYEIVWDQNHNTADDFEYVLKYKTSTGAIDYAQDGSGWSLDTTATTYKVSNEKLNGKILYVLSCYRITYTDGASGKVFKDQVDEFALADKGKVLTPAFRGSLVRTGYTFRGWYPEIAKYVTESATYTATWEANRYTIFLDPNGGTCSKDHIDVTYGSKLTNLPTPTRTGYNFSGWVDANGKKYSTYSTYDVAGNLYLTATWTARTYTAKFYQNNVANTYTSGKITYDQPYGDVIPEMEALPGFSSDGWYLMNGSKFTDTEITKDTIVATTSSPSIRVRRAILAPEVTIEATSDKFFGKGYEDVDGERVWTYIYISADPAKEITLTANVTKYDNLSYTYQWYKDGEAIEGATGETYTYARTVQNSGVYSVTVTAVNTATKVITTNTSAEGTASQDIRVEKVRNALMYYANNGTTNAVGSYAYDKTVTVSENPSFGKTGYLFENWNTLADGTGTTYNPGDSFTFETDDGNGGQSAALYAQWTAATYTLTFDADGGEVDPATKTVTYDAPVGELPVPTKAGYEFAGWFSGETAYTAETVYTVAGDSTLTAHWTPASYTLTLDFGGHKDNTTKPVTTDSPIGELPSTETQYVDKHDGGVNTWYFVGGWVDAEGKPVTAETIFNYASDTTIYAQWIPVPLTSGGPVASAVYTIQCDTNHDHSWICNSAQMKADLSTLKLVDGVWTCTATFSRLNLVNISTTQKDHFGGFKHYDLDGNVLQENRQKITVTLFYNTEAEGENKYIGKYKGEWQPVGGAEANVYHVKCYDKPAMPLAEKLTLSNLIKLIDTDKATNYYKPVSKDFKAHLDAIHIGEEMTEDNKNFYVSLTLDLAPFIEEFQAKYGTDYVLDENNEYGPDTVSFVLSYPKATADSGKDYAQNGSGWKIDASSYKNNTEKSNGKYIYLHNAYYITYTDGAKGTVFEDQVYKIALSDKGTYTPSFVGSYERTGYSFRGWKPEVAQTVTASATYTAQWQANRYIIFLNPNGGTCSKDHIDVTYGSKLSNLPTPTRTGYTFNGWYDADGNKYTTLTTYSVEGNTYLTAQWTAKTYTAKFYQNNVANTYTSGKITYDQPYGDVVPEMEALDGFSSDGWYLMNGKNFTDTEITKDTVVATTTSSPIIRVRREILAPEVTLEATSDKFFGKGYEDVDGERVWTHIYISADATKEITLTANVTKYDNLSYTYQWYKDGEAIEGATGETYTYARTVQNSGVYSVTVTAVSTATKVITTNTSAEATASQDIRVKPLSNTVIYKPNTDAITSGSKNASSYDATVTIADKPWHWNPTGYVFTGWNTAADGTGDAYQPGDTYTFADYDGNANLSLTLYAQWKPAEYTVSFDANGGEAVAPITVTYTGKYDGVPKTSPLIGFNSGKFWNLVDADGNVTDTKITKSSTVETARDHTLFMVRSLATPTVTIKCDKVGAYYDGNPVTLEAVIPENVKNDALLTYTYQWFKDGEAIEGATEQKLVLDGNVVDSGKYTVTVTATLPEDSTIVVEGEKSVSASADYTLRINKISNTVYYHKNTDDEVTNCPSSDFTNGNSISVLGSVPVRVGYTFVAWNTKADGTGDSYKIGDTISWTDETGNGGIRIDLYAQWKANTYTVTFNANGGAAVEPITVSYDGKYDGVPKTSPLIGFSSGKAWNLVDADGNVTDTKITKSSTVETARDHTLFMVRSLATPTVTIKSDKSGTYYDGKAVTLEAVIPENVKNDELLTYTYQWFKNGEAIEGATEQKLVLDGNVVDSGKYTVTVTATLPDDSTVVVEGEKSVSASANYTLRINKIANSLYYSANTEDAVDNCPSNNFSNGNTITVQTNVPTRVGYTFAGWNTKADGTGDSYKGGDVVTLTDETGNGGIRVDLYAQWTANTYTITLDAGDGKTEKVTVTYGQPIGELPTPTKDGYTFEGWYDADGNKIVSGLIYTTLGDTTLTAKWTAKTTNPSTGDNTPVLLYVTMMIFSVGALAAVTVCSKKRYFG